MALAAGPGLWITLHIKLQGILKKTLNFPMLNLKNEGIYRNTRTFDTIRIRTNMLLPIYGEAHHTSYSLSEPTMNAKSKFGFPICFTHIWF